MGGEVTRENSAGFTRVAGANGAIPKRSTEFLRPRMNWIFGYGSLMWRPGFAFRDRRPALLTGYHRAFCRLSFRHRGTPEAPGMVVGLMPGGSCRGIAYLPEPGGEGEALAYLDEREGPGYRRRSLAVEMVVEEAMEIKNGAATASQPAWVYVPEPSHSSYAPSLPRERIVGLIATGVGESGTARAYLRDLIAHLAGIGVHDPDLEAMLAAVGEFRKGAEGEVRPAI